MLTAFATLVACALIVFVVALRRATRPVPAPFGLAFDGDNTLWRCNEVYNRTGDRFYRRLQELFPAVSVEAIRDRFNAIDLAAATGPNAFAQTRYPTSMVATYEAYCADAGITPDAAITRELFAIGQTVFQPASYTPYPGMVEMLRRYRAAGVRIALCTKGDPAVQQAKIDHHGLRDLFDVVHLVAQKSATELAAVARDLRACRPMAPHRVIMVGDSLKDDIATAQQVGLETVWISGATDPHWAYETGNHGARPTWAIEVVTALPSVVPVPVAPSLGQRLAAVLGLRTAPTPALAPAD